MDFPSFVALGGESPAGAASWKQTAHTIALAEASAGFRLCPWVDWVRQSLTGDARSRFDCTGTEHFLQRVGIPQCLEKETESEG